VGADVSDLPDAVADGQPAGHCAWCGQPLEGSRERPPGRTRCPACRAWTTDPWPSPSALAGAYAGWYRPASGRFRGLGDGFLRRTRGALARRLDRIAPDGAVLDVGAGDGALLDALRRVGRPALGLERSPTRPDVVSGAVGEVGAPMAAVVFWHSLEHLPEPARALAEARRLLVPGGVIVIAVPNAESIQARLFGDRWLGLDLPRHLVHLGSPALLGRLGELGMRVERVSHLRGGQVVFGWVQGLVGTLPGRLDAYMAIRRTEARERPLTRSRRVATLAAILAVLPIAAGAALVEARLHRGGTLYVEARAEVAAADPSPGS
jgi:SAM-dependent methyltransferase